MDEFQSIHTDDSVALNSMMNSVRARRLYAYRGRCLVNWKKRECMRMKLKIAEMQMKIKRLLKQKRNLDTVLSKDVNKRSSVEAPIMMLLSSLKSQCLERKKRVDGLRKDMAQFVEQHREAWNRADAATKNSPRMTLVEDLKQQLAALKDERDEIAKERNAEKFAAQQDKELFRAKIIEFAKMMVTLKKIRELSAKNKELREKLELKGKKILPQNPERKVDNVDFTAINFGIFDVELEESDGESCVQESINGDGDYDLNCSVLSLGANEQGVGLTFGSSLGAPVAASTPNGETELNASTLEEEAEAEVKNVGNPEPVEEVVQEPMMVVTEVAKEDDVLEVQDVSENTANYSEEIDYRAKYAKSPENLPMSDATSPQPTLPSVSTGFNFLSSIQEAAGASGSLFGFGPAEPTNSSIFNLF